MGKRRAVLYRDVTVGLADQIKHYLTRDQNDVKSEPCVWKNIPGRRSGKDKTPDMGACLEGPPGRPCGWSGVSD